jgi:pilus assembly protein Flp/PilA
MKSLVTRFIKNESGATAIEYGLIAALVAVACIGAFGVLDGKLTTALTSIGNGLTGTASKVVPPT